MLTCYHHWARKLYTKPYLYRSYLYSNFLHMKQAMLPLVVAVLEEAAVVKDTLKAKSCLFSLCTSLMVNILSSINLYNRVIMRGSYTRMQMLCSLFTTNLRGNTVTSSIICSNIPFKMRQLQCDALISSLLRGRWVWALCADKGTRVSWPPNDGACPAVAINYSTVVWRYSWLRGVRDVLCHDW